MDSPLACRRQIWPGYARVTVVLTPRTMVSITTILLAMLADSGILKMAVIVSTLSAQQVQLKLTKITALMATIVVNHIMTTSVRVGQATIAPVLKRSSYNRKLYKKILASCAPSMIEITSKRICLFGKKVSA